MGRDVPDGVMRGCRRTDIEASFTDPEVATRQAVRATVQ
jgi:hypothetical protein